MDDKFVRAHGKYLSPEDDNSPDGEAMTNGAIDLIIEPAHVEKLFYDFVDCNDELFALVCLKESATPQQIIQSALKLRSKIRDIMMEQIYTHNQMGQICLIGQEECDNPNEDDFRRFGNED